MVKKLKRLILIDGNALIHRAYHALPPLTTKNGELVNAVYGFTTLMLKAIHDLKPDYVAVAFDLAGPTFRHEAYKEYKATRVKAPDELYLQFDRVKEIVNSLNIPIFAVKGFEADDVIGTLSKQAAEKGIETMIVTGDMDTLQLVNHLVKVYTMRRGFTDTVIYDDEAVKEKYGLSSKQFVDFKALKGDQSDNIPGVDGIGEKTAAGLIQAFGSLDKLYEWLEQPAEKAELPVGATIKLTPRIREILIKGKEQAYQSQDLSRIVCDVPLELDLKAATLKDYDRQKTIALFQELEFRSLLARLPEASDKAGNVINPNPELDMDRDDNQPSTEPKTHAQALQSALFAVDDPQSAKADRAVVSQIKDVDYQIVTTEKAFDELLKALKKTKAFVIDTETDYLNGPVIGLSFAVKPGQAWYVPAMTKEQLKQAGATTELDRATILKTLKPILEDQSINKIGHNMKYDYLALKKEGITVGPLAFDTMIASYLLNPSSRQHNLDSVAFVELGIEKIPLAELIGVKKLESLATVSIEKVGQYAAEDADVTMRLYQLYQPRLQQDNLNKVFHDIDMPIVPILAEMEANGVKLDCDFLQTMSKQVSKQQAELIAKIYDHAGQAFNINSPAQLSTILFDKLQLKHPDLKKTKTGISTAASELDKLRGLHPIIDLLTEYRELTKLLTTYIDVLPTLVDDQSRLHTSFNQTVAATGRLSSSDPNLQNIPIRTELGRAIRKAFIADRGYQLVSADYSQIELRVVAHMAKDPALIDAFKHDRDIHQEVADALKVDRRVGKTLNFAVLYGQGPYSTAQALGISMAQAKQYIDDYFARYSHLRQFLDTILRQAREIGYVETIFGRRRYIPEIKSSNFSIRAAAERIAMNMPLQGTAADLMKMAMIKIAPAPWLEKSKARLLLQVHDELVFEVPIDEIDRFAADLKAAMESVYELEVPLRAEVKVGRSWGEMTPLNSEP